ncbi:hypothetical protein KIH86_27730 [Paenibacillus sp. HN-1]|uniref:DUF6470 family protein n=1 Tax=Paenibacillus TaxID=44249 RepID=UPI000FC2AED0|nr:MULTISPECIES: DUF6470 family protein [Paenibacillus]MBY9077609.1 hypothetical protein [Paenibacillus sp. CGMCC 1.18879]MBY9087985.1 hypothetical protein [Paenibacillus sinensis]
MRSTGIDSSTWGKYIPAELTVRLRPAELTTDWTSVYNDLDLKRPQSLMKDLEQEARSQGLENIAIKAQEGDRMANLAAGEKNVFGAIAHSRYMRSGQKEVTVEALPSQGVYIDFRIYPPEIHVDPKGVLPR